MADRSIRDFQVPFVVAPVADAWAAANHFGLVFVEPDGSRHYQRGEGILTGQMLCVVRQSGPHVRIEAWIHARLVARMCAVFLIPTDMSVESGGMKGVLPRKMCRDAVDKLLAQLGQPPIDQSAAPVSQPASVGQSAAIYPPAVPTTPLVAPPGAPAVPQPAGPVAGGVPPYGSPGNPAVNKPDPGTVRPFGIAVLTVVEIVTALVALYLVREFASWSNWRFYYDDFGMGLVDAAIGTAYFVLSMAGFVVASRLWSLRPSAWSYAIAISGSLMGLIAFSVVLWGVEASDVLGIVVHSAVILYLNQAHVRALFGRPPLAFMQAPSQL